MAEKSNVNGSVWSVLICAWVAMASTQIVTFGYGMMMPGIMEEFGLDTAVMGRIAGIPAWFQVFLLMPLSMLLAKMNPKYSVPLVILAIAIGLFTFGRASGVPMLYAGNIIYASFANLIAALLVGAKLRGVPPDQYAQINGVENFIGPIGQVVATLAMAQLLVIVGGWRGVYTTISFVAVAALALYIVFWGNGTRITYGQSEAAPSADAPKTNIFSALKEAWSSKVVWLTGLAWPGTTIVWIAMFYFWPYYATMELGLDLPTVGLVLSMIPIFSAIASLTSPALAKKIGYDKPLICIWGLILPVCYYLMTRVSSVPLLCLFSAIAGYGAYCFVPLAFTNVYKIGLSAPAVTIATGTLLTFVSVGVAIAGTVVGALTTTLGLKNAITVSCLTPVWFGALTLFLPELGHKKMLEWQRMAAEKQA